MRFINPKSNTIPLSHRAHVKWVDLDSTNHIGSNNFTASSGLRVEKYMDNDQTIPIPHFNRGYKKPLPCVVDSSSVPIRVTIPLSTLIPGIIPLSLRHFTNGTPSLVFWYNVS